MVLAFLPSAPRQSGRKLTKYYHLVKFLTVPEETGENRSEESKRDAYRARRAQGIADEVYFFVVDSSPSTSPSWAILPKDRPFVKSERGSEGVNMVRKGMEKGVNMAGKSHRGFCGFPLKRRKRAIPAMHASSGEARCVADDEQYKEPACGGVPWCPGADRQAVPKGRDASRFTGRPRFSSLLAFTASRPSALFPVSSAPSSDRPASFCRPISARARHSVCSGLRYRLRRWR